MIVEKKTFLYYLNVSFVLSAILEFHLTSLEAGNRRRYFDACSQQIRESWKGGEKKKAKCSCCTKQRSFPSIDGHFES
jgi:hypothetical protein